MGMDEEMSDFPVYDYIDALKAGAAFEAKGNYGVIERS